MFNRFRNLGKYAGYQYSVVNALPASAGSESFFASASPAVANGFFSAAQLLTSPDNYVYTLDGDGVAVVLASGSTAQQHMTLDVYNTPLRTWYGPVTDYINNHSPIVNFTGATALSFPLNSAISHIDYNPFAFDSDNGDTVTITTASTLPTGLTLVAGVLQGTPTVNGAYAVTLMATDELGAVTNFPVITYTVFNTVSAPSVVGSDTATAETAITAAGLLFTTSTTYSALTPGTCVSQAPPAGTSMTLGDTVALTLASPNSTAPNVVGDTEAAAITAINAALLVPQAGTAIYSNTVVAGKVISQIPASGASVVAGATVTYVLSLGPQPTPPPTPPVWDPTTHIVSFQQAVAAVPLNIGSYVTGTAVVVSALSALPPGMSLIANKLQGTPTTPGSYSVGWAATDSSAQVTDSPVWTLIIQATPPPPPPPPVKSTSINVGRVIFGPIFNGEAVVNIFDFSSSLATNEIISSATVTATVYSGADTNPSTIVVGNASIGGAKVSQIIEGGVIGTIYAVECTIQTSLSQTLTLSAYYAVETNLP